MVKRSEAKIIPFKNPSGKIVHRVYGKVKGKNIRRNFSEKFQAEAFLRQVQVQVANQSLDYSPVTTCLSSSQVRDAERAFQLLSEHDADLCLENIVRQFVTSSPAPEDLTAMTVVADFIRIKRSENKRPRTISNLETRVKSFFDLTGITRIRDIQKSSVREFLERPGISPRTSRNDRLAISNFFSYCVDQQYLAENPIAKIKPAKVEEGEIRILNVEQAEKLIQVAREESDGAVLKYVAIALYAGIRPNEIERLDAKAIDLEHGIIRVTLAKARGKRIVEIRPVLQSILEETNDKPMVATNHRKIFDKVRALAGLKDNWQNDIMRHSFISYTLSLTNDENYTARQAGNSPSIIYKHYFALTQKTEAIRYFKCE